MEVEFLTRLRTTGFGSQGAESPGLVYKASLRARGAT